MDSRDKALEALKFITGVGLIALAVQLGGASSAGVAAATVAAAEAAKGVGANWATDVLNLLWRWMGLKPKDPALTAQALARKSLQEALEDLEATFLAYGLGRSVTSFAQLKELVHIPPGRQVQVHYDPKQDLNGQVNTALQTLLTAYPDEEKAFLQEHLIPKSVEIFLAKAASDQTLTNWLQLSKLEQIRADVKSLKADDPVESAPFPTIELAPLTGLPELSTNIHLDRETQWNEFRAACIEPTHGVFVLRGQKVQRIAWFVHRIQRFLQKDSGFTFHVVSVTTDAGQGWPQGKAGWNTCFYNAMKRVWPNESGDLKQLLLKKLGEAPVVICHEPPIYQLTTLQVEGLGEFLCRDLASIVHSPRGVKALKVLLALEYDDKSPGVLMPLREAWSHHHDVTAAMPLTELEEVHTPEWKDIHKYLTVHHGKQLTTETLDEVKTAFDKLKRKNATRKLTFHDVVAFVENVLDSHRVS